MKYLIIAIMLIVVIVLLIGVFSSLVVSSRENDKEYKMNVDNENTCVCCGKVIPEGRQICFNCEEDVNAI